MTIAPRIHGPIAEPGHESSHLLDSFLVGFSSFFHTGEFGLTQNACFRIAARPRDERGRTRSKEIDPVKGAVLLVEADDVTLDSVLPHVVAVEIEIERRFQFASVC